jgi:hypothetical protein
LWLKPVKHLLTSYRFSSPMYSCTCPGKKINSRGNLSERLIVLQKVALIVIPLKISVAILCPHDGSKAFVYRNSPCLLNKSLFAIITVARACSSVGRALGSHSRGQGFESPHVHQDKGFRAVQKA